LPQNPAADDAQVLIAQCGIRGQHKRRIAELEQQNLAVSVRIKRRTTTMELPPFQWVDANTESAMWCPSQDPVKAVETCEETEETVETLQMSVEVTPCSFELEKHSKGICGANGLLYISVGTCVDIRRWDGLRVSLIEGFTNPRGLCITNNDLFVADDETVVQCSLTGGKRRVHDVNGLACDVAAHGSRLFVAMLQDGEVMAIDVKSGGVSNFCKAQRPNGVTVCNGKVHVAETSEFRISIFDLDGSFVSSVDTGFNSTLRSMCADRDRVFTANYGFNSKGYVIALQKNRKKTLFYAASPVGVFVAGDNMFALSGKSVTWSKIKLD
jgi:hypothetical protein